MIKIKDSIIKELSELKSLTTYHYKIILYLLCEKEATQTEIAQRLEVKKQNINKVFKDLESMNIIIKNRVEGKNIFWALNPTPRLQPKGQLRLDI